MNFQLRRAARLWGIQTGYLDFDQKPVKTPEKTLRKLLEGLCGFDVSSNSGVDKAIRVALKRRVETILRPTIVIFTGSTFEVDVTLPKGQWTNDLRFELKKESEVSDEPSFTSISVEKQGRTRKIKFEGQIWERRSVVIPVALPVGYYTLILFRGGSSIAEAHLLSRPPKKVQTHPKVWGVFSPLYALKSKRNFGIGDFADMAEIQNWIHARGGDFFGTLPLFSALNEGEGADPSPYSPVSRLFWNEIYLDVEALAKESPKAFAKVKSADFQRALQQQRESDLVDHREVFALKKEILNILAEEFFSSGASKSEAYQTFLRREPLVHAYAKFRSAQSDACERYHLYVQFRVHEALEKIAHAEETGKAAGLYLDFPVGVSRSGFDADYFKPIFFASASAGAPPDLLFHGGQDWGFAPFHPTELRKTGYEYFRRCLRVNFRFASILRLDHIMAFYRIYAIPHGFSPKEGGYIRYRSDEFFAILAIEGEQSGARVVGEDLGTVPDEVRKLILENDCLRMWVFPFEVNDTPSKAIHKIEPQTLACLNTHDLIPFAGYIRARDSELYKELGFLAEDDFKRQVADRQKTIQNWQQDLRVTSAQDLLRASLKALGQSQAEMVLVNIEDLWSETEPQNVPGTWRERPNWQRKLKYTLSEIEENPSIREILETLNGRKKYDTSN